MKVYRTCSGQWINLEMCTCFYVDYGSESWRIKAELCNHTNQSSSIVTMERGYISEEVAKAALDKIVKIHFTVE